MRIKGIKRTLVLGVLALTLIPAPNVASAQPTHSGGTDKNGCHVCRTNCRKYGIPTGYYHRHYPVRPCR
jgi:hypothetical protein